MTNQLQNQIILYSVDTAAFYNDKEASLNKKAIEYKQYKSNLGEIIHSLNEIRLTYNKLLNDVDDFDKEVFKLQMKINKLIDKYKIFRPLFNEYIKFDEESFTYIVNKESVLFKSKQYIDRYSNELECQLDEAAEKHKGIRSLRKDSLKSSNKITQFESTLTRTLGIKPDETTTDIIVVRAYRYVIFKNIMENGFEYNGEKFQYFTSSAGNIRNKKSIWIKSSVYEKIKNKLMCGLSIDDINSQGGMNLNKFNAYTALCNTASTPWTDFDITKAIVVDDFSTIINAEVDYIDSETYKITRQKMDVEIDHVDGAGMCLPSVSEKSFQFRSVFFKGLVIPFPYDKFIQKNKASGIVRDIYGQEHNVIEEGILYIFTKSQFKMWRYFSSWKEYQDNFIEYGCEAAKCKEEVEVFDDKPISYQVLQTLNKMTKEELEKISKNTINIIENVGNDFDVMMKILGADEENEHKRGFEKALEIYPNLLNDNYSKEVIKEKKRSLVKSAKSGKLLIPGTKRTYIAPDLYAFCEWLFLGITNPNGLLKDGEISCALFKDYQKLDALRSPHLFREHCVRTNIVNDETNEWFITKNIYTSVKDLISKQLMFDVDGDDSLIVSDPLFISIAERHMKDIVPLQYDLKKATEEQITNSNIYNGLTAAYSKSALIGDIANDISKIWNSKEPDLNAVRLLCFESNACIDFAKTLWFPERPAEINERIKSFTKSKVAHFFRFAKDKSKRQVEKINDSVVNMLVSEKIIPDKRIHFEKVIEGFDYKKLMKNPRTKVDDMIVKVFNDINQSKHWDIKRQLKENGGTRKQGELAVYKEFRKELLKLNTRQHVVDVLIRYLYEKKKTKNKQSLWYMFGDDIVRNLQLNILGIVECVDCGQVIHEPKQRQIRCDSCQHERVKEKDRLRKTSKKIPSELHNKFIHKNKNVDTVGI